MRKAGDPNVLAKIASYLADNPLTQSWANTIDRALVTPVELQFVKQMPEREKFNAFATRLVDDEGRLNDRGRAFVATARKGHSDRPGVLDELYRQIDSSGGIDNSLNLLHEIASKTDEQAIGQVLDALAPRDGRHGLTQAGDVMRQFLIGSPVAAYSAVTAGGALATKGVMDLVARAQAGDPEAQATLELMNSEQLRN